MKCEFWFDVTAMYVMELNAIRNELNAMELSHDVGFTKREFEKAKDKVYRKMRGMDSYMFILVSLDWFIDHGFIRQIDTDSIKIPTGNVVVKMPDGTTERADVNYRGECSVTFEMPKTGAVTIEHETIDAKRYVYAIVTDKFNKGLSDANFEFERTIKKMNDTILAARNVQRYC